MNTKIIMLENTVITGSYMDEREGPRNNKPCENDPQF